MEEVTAYSI